MPIISVSISGKLENNLNDLISSGYYNTKSECIREALRNLFMRYELDFLGQNKQIVVAITALWDYHQNQIGKDLSRIREQNDNFLLSNFHVNVTKAYCLDVMIAAGSNESVFKLVKSVREIKHLDSVDFVILSAIPHHESH